ncbi:MAG: hypothetical protein PHR26_01845 [Candidatus ainarchaeum sp.]|nr:hypothetical protein [Candidatus ainarchaeum sp.]MDD3975967.1 hypothetical protein [Candidatus ainarchaeum sp.]
MDLLFLGFLGDMDLIIKIFFILAIVSFFKRKVENKKMSIFFIIITLFVTLFFFWPIFRVGYIFYVLLTIGIAGIFIDFFFVSAGGSPEEMLNKKSNTPGSPGGLENSMRQRKVSNMIKRPGGP